MKLTVAGTKDAVLMVEAGANGVSEDTMVEAIMEGHKIIKEIADFQETIVREIGKPKMKAPIFVPSEEIKTQVQQLAGDKLNLAIRIEEKIGARKCHRRGVEGSSRSFVRRIS